jgi:hypothetical protein
MNVYDEQLANDGRILHALGLMLQRQESGALAPRPVPVVRCAWCEREGQSREQKSEIPAATSHGICKRHMGEMKEQVARLHRIAA